MSVVRSYHGGLFGGNNIRSLVIEVSNDGSSWTEIDCRDRNNDLKDKYVQTANFEGSNDPSEIFRFFRLKQTGPKHYGDYHASLSSLEIFGTFREINTKRPCIQQFLI